MKENLALMQSLQGKTLKAALLTLFCPWYENGAVLLEENYLLTRPEFRYCRFMYFMDGWTVHQFLQ